MQPDPKMVEMLNNMSTEERRKLIAASTPRIVEPYMVHTPHPGPQQLFLTLNDRKEILYGGSAGSGKSDALLLSALQYVDVPGYSALILRRAWTDLVLPGAIMNRAISWLSNTPASKKDGGRLWEFPSGAVLQFGYLQTDADKYRYQGAEFQFIAFDEVTQFPYSSYSYLFSRLRKPQISCLNCGMALEAIHGHSETKQFKHSESLDGRCTDAFADPKVMAQYGPAPDGLTLFEVPLRLRSATNPGGLHGRWVKDRFVDPRTKDKNALFIPAKLSDNPSLNQAEYTESLSYLEPVEKARLLDGDWNIEEEGMMFQKHWFKAIDTYPQNIKRTVRAWDLAATADGDYTVGARVSLLDDGRWVIEDVVRFQKTAFDVEKLVKKIADLDGPNVQIAIEQEPGSSGKALIDHYQRNVLVGYNFKGIRPTGPKTARAAIVAAAADAGNVAIVVHGGWNRDFLDEVSAFPSKGIHDDQVDAVSLAFGAIRDRKQVRIIAG